ncbi:MAG: S41 family peptidase [Bacteroidota bacterium]
MPARLVLLLALTASVAVAQPVALEISVPDGTLPEAATLGVRGDTAPLAWDRSLPLSDDDGDGVYTATLDFPMGTGRVGYKLVAEAPGAEVVWEPGDNRMLVPGRMDADRRAFGGPQTDLPVLTVSQRQLAEDLTVLRSGMQALHPGLFLHNSVAEVEALSNRLGAQARALAAEYGEAIPMPEVYVAVAGAVAAIRDGHTQVSMYNQNSYTEAQLYRRADRVPFAFRLVGDRMIVTGDATPEAVLPTGTEVLTLDGRPVAEVIEALMPYASADGGNDPKRRDQLEVYGTIPPAERFDVFYSLLFDPEGDLALTVRRPDGTEADLSLPRVTRDARREVLWARDETLPRSMDDLLQYRLGEDGTAVLTIGSFSTFSMSVDYAAWLTGAFQDMNARGAERLVVDLRHVAGGMDDAAALLFQHILQEPVEVSFWEGVTAYDIVPEAVRPYVGSWSNDFYDLSARVTPNGDGTFRLPSRPAVTVPPAADAFQGPVAVLVDATASSATFYLADQIKTTGAALLVGQETGGSLKGLNAGQMVFLRLPNSGVTVDVPLYGARPPEPGPDRGVIPDVVVAPDADAVIAGRDPEMEAALAALSPEAVRLDDLAGDWTGTLVYTDYGDDATRVTLPITASGQITRDDRLGADALRLDVVFTEPDGSPGGTGSTTLAALPEARAFGYDGEAWQVLSHAASADGFEVVIEAEGADNNRPATIRHTIRHRDGVLTDRKDVRYQGTDAFFERNTVTLRRS